MSFFYESLQDSPLDIGVLVEWLNFDFDDVGCFRIFNRLGLLFDFDRDRGSKVPEDDA